MKFTRDSIILALTALITVAVLVAMFESREVFNISMLPTIKPGEYIMINRFAYALNQPKRGDVIVMKSPEAGMQDLVKRVIGLPGDTVRIHEQVVYVNNVALEEPYIPEPVYYEFFQHVIPDDNYFVLGDNRNHSADSHEGWFLPETNIIGKVLFTCWPPDRIKRIKHFRQ